RSVPTLPGLPMGSGCISPPMPATDITSGGRVFPRDGLSKSPRAPRKKRESRSLRTGIPSSLRSAKVRARCASTIRAAIGRSLRKASLFFRPFLSTARSCITCCAPRQRAAGCGIMAFFGVCGGRLCVGRHKTNICLSRGKDDGIELPNVVPAPLFRGRQLDFTRGAPSVSADGKWVLVQGGIERGWGAVVVYPVSGGSPTLVCGACVEPPNFERGFQSLSVDWTPD